MSLAALSLAAFGDDARARWATRPACSPFFAWLAYPACSLAC